MDEEEERVERGIKASGRRRERLPQDFR